MGPTLSRIAAAAVAAGVWALASPLAHAEPVPLNGLFELAPGVCSGGAVTGSFFRMILPTGDAGGPYLQNSDSRCSDQTVTPLSPGTDGGLTSGSYQAQPDAAFDGAGNARSGRVTTPVRFYGVDFATATNPADPQTGAGTALPQLFSDGGQLSGDLSSLGVTWNNQVFNQGSPKPGGGLPGKTGPVHGTIDGAGNFVLEWTSQIVGGPFNNFTGLWHLAGRYHGQVPAAPAAAPVAPAPAAPGPVVPGPPGAAAPAAPGPAAPANAAPGPAAAVPPAPGVAAQSSADPALATRTIDIPHRQHTPVWVIPALVLLAVIAAAVFVKAEALVPRKRQ
ncbi:hypothetical protein NONO_c12090 [Nocardia nova SH22a]|uniref:Secreted protein n=1 Tax=Nocardia nova SH22a TaxID=1415166 RepID=W5TFI9_9NOCA|nr:hypothetical protein [Nocardia nova]AHH16016.1 hypothetical protein NONO_c12090 [Nocardia nova SH22a]